MSTGNTRNTGPQINFPQLTREQREQQLRDWMADNDQCHLVSEAFKKHFPNEPTTDYLKMIERILNKEFSASVGGVQINPMAPAGVYPLPNQLPPSSID